MTKTIREDASRGAQQPTAKIDFEAGRRAFIRNCGLTAAGAAIFGTVGSVATSTPALAGVSDTDILNFALNLEYLEAEFYLQAAFGRGLGASDRTGEGKQGAVVGGRKVNFKTTAFRLYAEEIANDEEAHVKFLRGALGQKAVAEPAIDLTNSFTAAARAAKLIGPTETFDAFKDENSFLLSAFIFEDVGVTAYKGAAPLLKSSTLVEYAAGILAVEAYHAGILRTVLYSLGFYDQAQKISDARDSLDGSSDMDQGIGDATKSNLVPTDKDSIVYSRTVPQVRAIAYLSPTADRGGFFPAGINGAFGPDPKGKNDKDKNKDK